MRMDSTLTRNKINKAGIIILILSLCFIVFDWFFATYINLILYYEDVFSLRTVLILGSGSFCMLSQGLIAASAALYHKLCKLFKINV